MVLFLKLQDPKSQQDCSYYARLLVMRSLQLYGCSENSFAYMNTSRRACISTQQLTFPLNCQADTEPVSSVAIPMDLSLPPQYATKLPLKVKPGTISQTAQTLGPSLQDWCLKDHRYM